MVFKTTSPSNNYMLKLRNFETGDKIKFTLIKKSIPDENFYYPWAFACYN